MTHVPAADHFPVTPLPAPHPRRNILDAEEQLIGTGTLTKTGPGDLQLVASNSFSGAMVINGGYVECQVSGSAGSGQITVNSGGELVSIGATIANSLLLNAGAKISGDNHNTTVFSGTVNAAGNFTVAPRDFYRTGQPGRTVTFSGVISGPGTLTVDSTGATPGGAVVLAGANTYTGGTIILSGTVSVGTDANLGAANGGVTINGGTLSSTNTTGPTIPTRVFTIGAAGGTINVSGNLSVGKLLLNHVNQLVGTGTLTKTGTGDFQPTASNSFSGPIIINGGYVEAQAFGSLGTGQVTINPGGELDNTATTLANNLLINGGTLSSDNHNPSTYSGAITAAGNFTIAPRDYWQSGQPGRTLVLSGAISGGGAMTINSTGATSPGTVILTGTSTAYTGNIINASGILRVDGSIVGTGAGSTVTVAGGSTLAGTGGIGGAVSISSGGVLTPGNYTSGSTTPGTLATGNLSLASGSSFNETLSTSAFGQANVTGTVNLNNATLNLTGTRINHDGDVITLINNDGTDAVIGTFLNRAEGSHVTINNVDYILSYHGNSGGNGNDVTLTDSTPLPTLNTLPPQTAVAGATFQFPLATLSGDNLDRPFTATIDWGDGTTGPGTIALTAIGDTMLSGQHTYATVNPAGAATPYTVTLTLALNEATTSTTTTIAVQAAPTPFLVPGALGTMTDVTFTITNQTHESRYHNQLGLLFVKADGSFDVGSVHPTDANYTSAALHDSSVQSVFAQNAQAGITQTYSLPAGKLVDFFFVQDDTIEDYLNNAVSTGTDSWTAHESPGDSHHPVSTSPLRPNVFFLNAAANSDGYAHFRTSPQADGSQLYEVEDIAGGGDQDFNDLVFTISAIPSAIPTVSIIANRPNARETGPTDGQLTVTRSIVTNQPLNVSYSLDPSSTATAGQDFAALSGTVTIPANAASVTIDIMPVDDSIVENTEDVVVALATIPNNGAYVIGDPASASVQIVDNDSVASQTTGSISGKVWVVATDQPSSIPTSGIDFSYFTTIRNTDVASAGFGGMRDNGSGSIQLSGVSGAITHAYLFWNGPTDSNDRRANDTVVFNGHGITGVNIGFSSDNGWEYLNSQSYRADVTHFVNGNGLYALHDFTKNAANANGASLIVFYNDASSANDRDVIIYNGNDSNAPNGYDSDGWNLDLNGINYTSGSASLELHASDGQSAAGEGGITINGDTLVPDGQIFSGDSVPSNPGRLDEDRALWDKKSFNIDSFLTPGDDDLAVKSDWLGEGDLVSLVVATVNLPAGSAPAVPSWTVYLDQNQNGRLDAGEASAATDNDGTYAFTGLAPGTYHMAEVPQVGWDQVAPTLSSEWTVQVTAGTDSAGKDFANERQPTAAGPLVITSPTTPTTNIVVDKSVGLTVGAAGGSAAITYAWHVTSSDGAADPTFSSADSGHTVATFSESGTYSFYATVTSGTSTLDSNPVTVTVQKTPTSIAVTPQTISLVTGQMQQFNASVLDQFGDTTTTPVAWSSSDNAIDANGLYTAPQTGNSATVIATAGNTTPGTAEISLSATPEVTIGATADASEAGPTPGRFLITRSGGDLAQPLSVTLAIDPSSTAGSSDYQSFPTTVTIPAGQFSVPLLITPVDDTEVEADETLTLRVVPSVNHYHAGTGDNDATATIVIYDNDLPAPTIVNPASASETTVTGTTVNLSVLGGDLRGESTLKYHWDANSDELSHVLFTTNDTNSSKSVIAQFQTFGTYTFTVTVTDAENRSTSSSVEVNVVQSLVTLVVSPSGTIIPLSSAGNASTFSFHSSGKDQFGANYALANGQWSVSEGSGTIDASTGVFTAPNEGRSSKITFASNSLEADGFVGFDTTSANFAATSLFANTVALTWQKELPPDETFKIYRGITPNFANSEDNELVDSLSPSHWEDNDVEKGSTYYYQLFDIDSNGARIFLGQTSTTTPQTDSEYPLNAPLDTRAMWVNQFEIFVTWAAFPAQSIPSRYRVEISENGDVPNATWFPTELTLGSATGAIVRRSGRDQLNMLSTSQRYWLRVATATHNGKPTSPFSTATEAEIHQTNYQTQAPVSNREVIFGADGWTIDRLTSGMYLARDSHSNLQIAGQSAHLDGPGMIWADLVNKDYNAFLSPIAHDDLITRQHKSQILTYDGFRLNQVMGDFGEGLLFDEFSYRWSQSIEAIALFGWSYGGGMADRFSDRLWNQLPRSVVAGVRYVETMDPLVYEQPFNKMNTSPIQKWYNSPSWNAYADNWYETKDSRHFSEISYAVNYDRTNVNHSTMGVNSLLLHELEQSMEDAFRDLSH